MATPDNQDLLKKIKKQEVEIEDLEDEVSDLKKKLSKLKTEKDKISEELDNASKNLKLSQTELQEIQSEQKKLQLENLLNIEAIEFANAILSAPKVDDSDANSIAQHLKRIKEIILDDYVDLQKSLNEYDDANNGINIINRWANIQQKSWIKNKKVVAFIGEFSAGKTSIINRILSNDNPNIPLLPVSSKATTAIATYISYGSTFLSRFTDPKGDLKKISIDIFNKVNKNILSKINASSLIQYFVIQYNNENLKNLSILDTPGFSSNDKEDQSRTIDVINEADALFWVVDAQSGTVNRSSLEIISQHINNVPLYIIINKSDTKSPKELEQLENQIKKTMKNANIPIKDCIKFSQKSDLTELLKIINNIQISEARTGNDILEILFDLETDCAKIEATLNEFRSELQEYSFELENLNEDIINFIDVQQTICQDLVDIPREETHWIADNDYRMDKYEYQNFCDGCKNVFEYASKIEESYNEWSEIYEKYKDLEIKCEKDKENHKIITKIQKDLLSEIKKFDKKLYSDIKSELDLLKKNLKSLQNDKTHKKTIATTISSLCDNSLNKVVAKLLSMIKKKKL
ncbi:MAG: dynamin family protein [Paludibacteraceae bacterium]|nr:dynamin family protein [Paludibacteraceae bacterium]